MPTATFAIISDLHCRLAADSHDSFLTVGGLRSPSNRHPVQALLDLIDKEHLTADALLVPGDLTNKARLEGLQQGWDYALEIGRKLAVPAVVPVIGNHDIDSYRTIPDNPVTHNVRNLRPGFPFSDDAAVQSFFADGYCLLRIGDSEILAVNTVIDHTDVASAKRGAFGIDRIVRMERALEGRFETPLRAALMHHHPVLHTGTFLGDTDVIPTGDALLDALRRLGCRLVIHGHKHYTRLSYVDGVAILACGSFSALLNEFGTSVANTFHMVRVEGDQPDLLRGIVHTWVFRFGSGWKHSNTEHAGFPYLSGFGRQTPLAEIVGNLRILSDGSPRSNRFLENEVLAAAPDAEYLTPGEREQANEQLAHSDLKLSDYENGKLELWRLYRP